jgi:hypothetical protein
MVDPDHLTTGARRDRMGATGDDLELIASEEEQPSALDGRRRKDRWVGVSVVAGLAVGTVAALLVAGLTGHGGRPSEGGRATGPTTSSLERQVPLATAPAGQVRDAASVATLCSTYATPLNQMGADGLPNLAQAITDSRYASHVLVRQLAVLQGQYPGAKLEVGPGFGRAWVGKIGGDYSIVAIHDYAIIVHLQRAEQCPPAGQLFISIENVSMFFAWP